VAEPDQQIPLAWSKTENVVWKTAVPGRGHGSPIIVGGRVFLQTADEVKGLQTVLCFDRTSGKELWKVDVSTPRPSTWTASSFGNGRFPSS
jgi:outer membrane protein assembly factor BamB